MFIMMLSVGILAAGAVVGYAYCSTQFGRILRMNAYERMSKRDYEKFKELLAIASKAGGK